MNAQKNQTRSLNTAWERLAATLVTLLCLMGAAIWNGYPIVYSDSSSYLVSGFNLETLIDRPITYGLFIRVTSLNGWSLWTVIMVQSLLLAYVAGLTLKWLGQANAWYRTFIIGGTALLTGLPFLCGQLITDVFTPILVLTLFLLLFAHDLPTRTRAIHFGLFLLAFAMHMSHVSITVLMLGTAWLIRRMAPQGPTPLLFWRTTGIITLLAVVGILTMGVSLAKSKYSFYAAHLAEIGVLQQYLEEHCATENLIICNHSGSIPHSADAFLWAEDSPLHLYEGRQEMEAELGRITRNSLLEPALLWIQLKSAARASLLQLAHFKVGDGNGSFGHETLLHQRVEALIPSEIGAFDNTRQMQGTSFQQPLTTWNRMLNAIMVLALVGLLAAWWRHGRLLRKAGQMRKATLFLVAAVVINATMNASLVMVADRFGAKLAWLIPFLCITTWMYTLRGRAQASRCDEQA